MQTSDPASPAPGPAVVLVGAPGAGKSTVGRRVAARLGLPFADTDTTVEERAGKPVAEIFADDGEPAFRVLEEAITAELLAGTGVVALGGGAVLSAATRAALVGHRVVWLQVAAGEAAKRVGLTQARPLLLGNVRGRLVRLLAERAPLYAGVATDVVDTGVQGPDQVAEHVAALVADRPAPAPPTRIRVATAQPYEVVVGHQLAGLVRVALGDQVRRVAVIHPAELADRQAALAGELTQSGFAVEPIEVPGGEAAKTAEVAAACWVALGAAGFTRSDAVLALGGGATTDLAGFVAGTWLRGVRLVSLPTTVLAMVDAAVGGKTGINTAAGKNLVGVFHEPAAVLCDLDQLTTLPAAELRSGLAEVVKCGFLADPVILDRIESDPAAALDPGSAVLRDLLERSIAVKAAVVAADLREATSEGTAVGREQLNYGHTLGHAIERREGYRWRHGDAVSIGLVFVAELSRRAGHLDPAVAARHRRVLSRLGLPVSYPADAFEELLGYIALDKKTRGARLRFVILDAPGRPRILEPSTEELRAAYAALAG